VHYLELSALLRVVGGVHAVISNLDRTERELHAIELLPSAPRVSLANRFIGGLSSVATPNSILISSVQGKLYQWESHAAFAAIK
jgi:hypothetical protein